MRRRLSLAVLAVTSMVTIAFLIPLAFVVRVAAEDRALSAADQEARSLGGVLAAVVDPSGIASVVEQLNAESERDAAVFLPDGTRIGAPIDVPESELAVARTGRAFTASSGGYSRVWVPVTRASGAVVVAVVAVPEYLLHQGVTRAWVVLAGVGVVILLLGVALADRLGRPIVASIEQLETVTRRLQRGELDARVAPSGPPEVVDVGLAVNELAGRIKELLVLEREAVADLSHRLRTPLTALQLEADGLADAKARGRVSAAVKDLTDAVNAIIWEARQQSPDLTGAAPVADLRAVVEDRLAFWSVLAEDQERTWELEANEGPLFVNVDPDALAAALDALLANVFAHTPEGVGFRVEVAEEPDGARLVVEDYGPGFRRGATVTRGSSTAGSTGLGLDIVRQTAERAGGSLSIGTGQTGGARVEARLLAASPPPRPRRVSRR